MQTQLTRALKFETKIFIESTFISQHKKKMQFFVEWKNFSHKSTRKNQHFWLTFNKLNILKSFDTKLIFFINHSKMIEYNLPWVPLKAWLR